ncbi:MAG TPA: NDMA-dependent alcohol dehydrogenase [Ilumatobacteraceae bacterium]|nr:NDMA-dependent alcohol dehydrogenase [Ilumatobacteraceae bacterium]
MMTRAAVLWERNVDWVVEDIELDAPRTREVVVELAASGLCHSDEHIRTGDSKWPLPIVGGHEGAGVIVEVGPEVERIAVGDHVVLSFVPSCGQCPSCSSGHQNLCDLGAHVAAGRQIGDHTARHHARGQDLGIMCLLGTFAERTVVNEASCVKIHPEIPLQIACLLGCGVVTGWGSAVYAAEVRAGETVVVVGIGGVGSNAVQGAALAGAERIVAVDPIEFKREMAQVFGATHTAASIDEAKELVAEITWGRMADKVIMTMGLGKGELIADAMAMTAKRGRVVLTNVYNDEETLVHMSPGDLIRMEKQLVGALFGSANPRKDIPRLLELWQSGKIKLDELVTRTYSLDDINVGYQDMRDGKNIRGVLTFT